MLVNKSQMTEILEAATPLMDWLKANAHPHCEITVSQESAELLEGIATVRHVAGRAEETGRAA